MSTGRPAEPAPAADPMLPRVARVRGRRRDGPQTWTLAVEPDDGGAALAFAPGQFAMLTAFGVGEAAISMSGDPDDERAALHTIRAVGPVSRALTRLRPGDVLGVRGPFGSAWPLEEAEGLDVVVVAGGLGLAPLRPAIYRLLARRERYGRVVLLYGTRSPGDVLFRREVEAWRARPDLEVEVTVDHAFAGWPGHVGVVTSLLARTTFDVHSACALVCGPEVMMRFTLAALRRAGLAGEAVFLSVERNMKCAVGFCGRCQLGPLFVCRDGPVFRADRLGGMLMVNEL